MINEYPLQAGSVIKVRLIGVLIMEDESGMDEKLIAVPISKIDPRYDGIKSLNDLPKITLDRIKNSETYKCSSQINGSKSKTMAMSLKQWRFYKNP